MMVKTFKGRLDIRQDIIIKVDEEKFTEEVQRQFMYDNIEKVINDLLVRYMQKKYPNSVFETLNSDIVIKISYTTETNARIIDISDECSY